MFLLSQTQTGCPGLHPKGFVQDPSSPSSHNVHFEHFERTPDGSLSPPGSLHHGPPTPNSGSSFISAEPHSCSLHETDPVRPRHACDMPQIDLLQSPTFPPSPPCSSRHSSFPDKEQFTFQSCKHHLKIKPQLVQDMFLLAQRKRSSDANTGTGKAA